VCSVLPRLYQQIRHCQLLLDPDPQVLALSMDKSDGAVAARERL
jgi:hypothetical protein